MSFPKKDRSLTDASFVALAKYANNDKDKDISLLQCSQDLEGTGHTAQSDISFSSLKDFDKSDNFYDASLNLDVRRCRVNVKITLNSPFVFVSGAWSHNGEGVSPSLDPSGTDMETTAGSPQPLNTNQLTAVRLWMWSEERSTPGSETLPGTLSERLWFSGFDGGDQVGASFPGTWDRSGLGGSSSIESDYDDSLMNKDRIYGVPQGFGLSRYNITHRYNGSGTYYLWVGIGYRIGSTDSPGWNESRIEVFGAWLGPYSRGTTRTLSIEPDFGSQLRNNIEFTERITGLEDSFDPDDTYSVGIYNKADFGIEVFVTTMAWIPAP
jgi:hypothetical protein